MFLKILTSSFLLFSVMLFGQKKVKKPQPQFDEGKYAKRILRNALKDSTNHLGKDVVLLKDTTQVIKFSETVLFPIYGEEEIKSEKPYKIYYLENYWVMFGTLHTMMGGTFVIVIDSYDYRIVDMYHEK